MPENQRYDLFIAYHGDANGGTQSAAEAVYRAVHGFTTPGGHTVKAYFHPVTNPFGEFEVTPMIAARTPLFLFVAGPGVPVTDDGQLQMRNEQGILRNIYDEVQSFHNTQYKQPRGETAARIFAVGGLGTKQAERLHPMFSGKVVFTAPEQLRAWLIHYFDTPASVMPADRYMQNTAPRKKTFRIDKRSFLVAAGVILAMVLLFTVPQKILDLFDGSQETGSSSTSEPANIGTMDEEIREYFSAQTNQIPADLMSHVEQLHYSTEMGKELMTCRTSVGSKVSLNGWSGAACYSGNTAVATIKNNIVTAVGKGKTYVVIHAGGAVADAYLIIVE